MFMKKKITAYLENNRKFGLAVYAIAFAFITYFSMYAFRKPFTVGTFSGNVDLGFLGVVNYKICLIISQATEIALAKFCPIR